MVFGEILTRQIFEERVVRGAPNYFCTGIFLARNISLTKKKQTNTHLVAVIVFYVVYATSNFSGVQWSMQPIYLCCISHFYTLPACRNLRQYKNCFKRIGFMKQRNHLTGAGHSGQKNIGDRLFLQTEFVRIVLILQCVIHPRS